MYGLYTGKVVFVSHRCARCPTCISAAARGATVIENHECANNCDGGAAGNMEMEILHEGANALVTALFDAGVIVQSLMCDGDYEAIHKRDQGKLMYQRLTSLPRALCRCDCSDNQHQQYTREALDRKLK